MATENVRYIISAQDRLSGKMGKMTKATSALRGSIVGIGASMGLAFGAVRAIGGAITTIKDFEKSMSVVKTLTRATDEQFEALEDTAKKLGSTTAFSASQASDGMAFLARAGFETNEIIEAMPATLSLASAGQLELAEAADIASNVLSGFALSADQMNRTADVLSATANSSNTSVRQLGEGMKYAAPLAQAAGVSLEETAAAMGMLGNAGIQASMAGTNMRMAISTLISKKGQKDLEKFGIKTKDASGELKNIADIVGEMKSKGLRPEDVMAIFGERAGTGMNVLLQQGADAMREFTLELRNSKGESKRVAEGMENNLSGDITKLSSAYEGFVIGVLNGNGRISTSIRSMVQGVTKAVSFFNDMNQASGFTRDVLGEDALDGVMFRGSNALSVVQEYLKVLEDSETQTHELISTIGDLKGNLTQLRAKETAFNIAGVEGNRLRLVEDEIKVTEALIKKAEKRLSDAKKTGGKSVKKQPGTPSIDALSDGSSISDASTTITARSPKNFIINIENLVDDGINITTNNMREGSAEVSEMLTRALVKALNDSQNLAN